MKAISEGRFDPWLHAVLVVMVAFAFLADLLLPLGTANWLVYVLAIALSSLTSRASTPLILAGVSTVLIVIVFSGAGWRVCATSPAQPYPLHHHLLDHGRKRLFFHSQQGEVRRQEWVRQGQVAMAARVSGEQSVEQLSDNTADLSGGLSRAQGASDLRQPRGTLCAPRAFGLPSDAPVPAEILPGDGLIGQVARDGRLIDLSDVPENYLYIGSALGRSLPRRLMTRRSPQTAPSMR